MRCERLADVRPAKREPHPRALGRPGGGARPSCRPTHAIPRLRQVDQLEVEPERANYPLERRRVHREDVEGHPLVRTAPPCRDRVLARGLDELEDVFASLLHDDLAEQRPEQPHLAREHVAGPGGPDAARLGQLGVPAGRASGGARNGTGGRHGADCALGARLATPVPGLRSGSVRGSRSPRTHRRRRAGGRSSR